MVEKDYKIILGDCLETLKSLPDESVQCCITSPPYYGLRDYGTGTWVGGDPNCPHYRTSKYSENTCTGHKAMAEQGEPVGDAIYKTVCPICGAVREDKQIGLEETPEQYVEKLVEVFREVRRVLKDDGTLWLNLGDTYNTSSYKKDEKSNGYGKQGTNKGTYENVVTRKTAECCKPKDLIGIPWMVAFALRADGWWLRQDIIFSKNNPMPEPVKDRCTKSHEYIFLLTKKPHYKFNYESIQEVATGYDGRKDTLHKGSPKYAETEIVPGQSIQSLAKSPHERWKFKEANDVLNSLKQAYGGETVRVDSGIKFGGNKYGDSDDPHYQTYSGDSWQQKLVVTEDGLVPVRNKRSVWNINLKPFSGAHFATYPEELVIPCVLAGTDEGDTVLDPFNGAATTGVVALKHGRKYIGCELNQEYIDISENRIKQEVFGQQIASETAFEGKDNFERFDLGE